MNEARPGWTYLVGTGPGDPEQLTVRAAAILASAERIWFADAVSADVVGMTPTERIATWHGNAAGWLEWRATHDAPAVAIAVPGAPLPALNPVLEGLVRMRARVEVVSGIGPVTAAASYAGLDVQDPRRLGVGTPDWTDTVTRWRDLGHDSDDEVVVVAHPGTARQQSRTTTLAALQEAQAPAGAVAAIGRACDRREHRRWFDRWPLFGRRVLVTRPEHQLPATTAELRRRGAEPLAHPTIALRPPPEPDRVLSALDRMGDYDLVVFTSPNGVDGWWRALEEAGRDARAFRHAEVAAIGSVTAARLAEHGVVPDIVAPRFVAEELATAILDAWGTRRGGKVLLPRALVAREVLPATLRAHGFTVDVVPVYETVPAPNADALRRTIAEGVDAVLFTSSSTVDHFIAALGPATASLLATTTVASIGPITTATAERHGLRVAVTAATSTSLGLVDALEEHFSRTAKA
ncbi:MAG: uroporphyrinogen-III synthase [Myxococcota bacterium]